MDVFVKELRVVALEFVVEAKALVVGKVSNRLHVRVGAVVAAMRMRVGLFLGQMGNQQFRRKEFIEKTYYKNTKIY